MTKTSQVCLGIDWAGEIPAMRLAEVGSTLPAMLMPLDGALCFRAVVPPMKYCAGWFDLRGPNEHHVVCDAWRQLDTGKQCSDCRRREGFLVAHQRFDAALVQLPENLRAYLSRPHQLYVAGFADGSVKVGTVAGRRLRSRLAEQGPVAAYYVAGVANGLDVRRLEAAVSSRLNLAQAVAAGRKLRALTAHVDVAKLRAHTFEVATQVTALVAELAIAGFPADPIDPPQPWHLPSISAAVFKATPLTPYPDALTVGEHSLYLRGLSGSIAICTVVPDDDADLYVASLGQLCGRPLAFGKYESTVSPVQPALF